MIIKQLYCTRGTRTLHGGRKGRRKCREDEELINSTIALRASVGRLSEIQRHPCFAQVNVQLEDYPGTGPIVAEILGSGSVPNP